jgi:hypothetical protein
MSGTARQVGSLLLIGNIAVAASGCDLLPDPEFSALPESLILNIVEATRKGSGNLGDFRFELTNRGSSHARACFGPNRTVYYETGLGSGGISGGSSMSVLDHPGCIREFTIQPGAVLAWDETLEVPSLSSGRVGVEVSIQIVNPRRCGGLGCPEFEVKSNHFEIP